MEKIGSVCGVANMGAAKISRIRSPADPLQASFSITTIKELMAPVEGGKNLGDLEDSLHEHKINNVKSVLILNFRITILK